VLLHRYSVQEAQSGKAMNLELTPNEILYKFETPNIDVKDRLDYMPEYDEVYKKIKTSMEIDKEGYNVYLIDNFSKDKIKNIIDFVEELFNSKKSPRDICYVTYEDDKRPKVIFLSNGMGMKLKKILEELQSAYAETTFKFYNNSGNKDKDDILQHIQRKRSELVGNLIEMAKSEGFDVRPTHSGFTFIPLKDGEAMTEKEYDELEVGSKDNILDKVSTLRNDAQDILEALKNMETESVNKIKEIMITYYEKQTLEIKNKFLMELRDEPQAVEYLKSVCDSMENNLVENYSTSYEDDEEKINEIIYRYVVNVIVDNSGQDKPQVIFEEDPNVINLLGSIEYENHNGTYVTDVNLINGGSLLAANEGCVIIRASSLFNHPAAYYYLKKTLLSEKVKFDYNRGYLELLSLGGLKPEPIDLKVKVILIGDYETYDLLYSYDEDFKNIFKIRAENNPVVDTCDENKLALIRNIIKEVSSNSLKPLSDGAIKEVAKYLARKAGDRKKFLFDDSEMSKILILANNRVQTEGRDKIESRDIISIAYSTEQIEKEILENYKEKKIIFATEGEAIGSVNGLSVIDTGYFSFGKPLRITCTCCKGDGSIVDIQKESNLSGNIHSKSINILRGYFNNILGGYSKIPVDFHLSFEQLYGKIDGDSASVAEVVCMISALSKIPVKQSIAVTGSINQFGEVQPIGGVNEKIEGFYNVCRLKGDVRSKGVLIPYSNKDDLILNDEVENSVKNGDFHIYVMDSVRDAVTVLMANEKYSTDSIFEFMERELKKYNSKK
jgi:predicted ATP-dependent protease